jgi:hypothetical protein
VGKLGTGTDLIQQFLAAVLFHGLVPPFDKKGLRVHNMGVVGPAPQASLPIKTPGLVPRTRHKSTACECCAQPITYRHPGA